VMTVSVAPATAPARIDVRMVGFSMFINLGGIKACCERRKTKSVHRASQNVNQVRKKPDKETIVIRVFLWSDPPHDYRLRSGSSRRVKFWKIL
jgi:hypothetical protein